MKHLLLCFLMLLGMYSCNKDKECPQQYKGSDCDIEIKPGRVRVTRIQLTNYPATNGGSQWDVSSTWADPYFEISSLGGVIYESPYLNEQQSASISQWDVDLVLNPDNSYSIVFYDEDGSTDTYIDGRGFAPYIEGSGFPERHTFFGDEGSQISVWVQYEY